ncbi:hypothetical protein G7Y89_g3008 [Cudoniella acicularis]|uniref:Uncharacterized protein n=1 Tax=Cudoniella acicularis TaxID=354080 RepID=A0A8H4W5K8_9HELO|nr:hypothetical protein G7Y89_g3008 [Cudoniella acicularis]
MRPSKGKSSKGFRKGKSAGSDNPSFGRGHVLRGEEQAKLHSSGGNKISTNAFKPPQQSSSTVRTGSEDSVVVATTKSVRKPGNNTNSTGSSNNYAAPHEQILLHLGAQFDNRDYTDRLVSRAYTHGAEPKRAIDLAPIGRYVSQNIYEDPWNVVSAQNCMDDWEFIQPVEQNQE